jgi:polysaccharide transporter, PST family
MKAIAAQAQVPLGAAGLFAQARTGTHAVFATRLLSVVCTAASITIMARLIAPADFGVWAMAALPLGLMTIVRELGLVPAIVQARELDPEQQDAYFWTSVGASLAVAALLALAAPLLASFYDAPLLRPVVWVCCISLAVSGIGLVHAALLRRGLQYDKVALIEGGGMVCGLAVGLAGAFLWRDVWALVAAHLASAVWMCGSAWLLCRWRPGAPGGKPAVNLPFSLQLTLSNLLAFAGNNVGLAVGYKFPAADLGFFNRGQQLFNLANFAFLTPITEVGFALLCRLKSGDAYRHAYVALARRVAVLFIPYALVLPLVAPDLVRALLGPAWDPAAPILAWFAPAVFAQAFAALFAQLLMSQGRGTELRNFGVIDLLVRAGGAMLGSPFGVAGMAAGFSLATLVVSVPLMLWIGGRSGPVKLRHQVAAAWPGVVLAVGAALAAAAAALAAQRLNLDAGWTRLFLVGGSGALAWGAFCALLPAARHALLGKGEGHA